MQMEMMSISLSSLEVSFDALAESIAERKQRADDVKGVSSLMRNQ